MKLNVNDKAPKFAGVTQDNQTIRLSDFAGKKLLLYFYPKDNTPGCTRQACNLRDNYEKLQAAGYAVVGVSSDDVVSHQKFATKYNLPFPLIADVDHAISKAYGTQRTLWFPKRTTFVIDEKGHILRIIDSVKTGAHSKQILA